MQYLCIVESERNFLEWKLLNKKHINLKCLHEKCKNELDEIQENEIMLIIIEAIKQNFFLKIVMQVVSYLII